MEKLLQAWQEFLRGKKNRSDVILFQARLMDNIFDLYNDLKNKTYMHGGYHEFNISDPKPRIIHKASVRDRLLHHLIYQELYGYFDTKFIYDSYSCRLNKGTHKALHRFKAFARKVSKNNTQTCYVLKCDIRKFFANIDHNVLKSILEKHIKDKDILWLLGQIIDSFHSTIMSRLNLDIGLPLGNLTSQLLVNIYMNEFDQFVKRNLKMKYYIRYADDFAILSEDKKYLKKILIQIDNFLQKELKLELHPNKVFIKTIASGIDFLGWIHFPYHRVLRTVTKNRMMKNLANNPKKGSVSSYLGMLKHGNAFKIRKDIEKLFS